jgi:hypothetical protein
MRYGAAIRAPGVSSVTSTATAAEAQESPAQADIRFDPDALKAQSLAEREA